jgi:probable phosphoglycerate mutase
MVISEKEMHMPLKLDGKEGNKRLATRVILVRHGQSTYNLLGLYQGSSDESVLTEKGRHAARQTGAFLNGLSFDAIYTSSLKRAQETASEMLAVMAPAVDVKKIHVVKALRETDMPAWEGLPFQYVREQFAADYRCWKQRPHEFRMEIPQQGVQGEQGSGFTNILQQTSLPLPPSPPPPLYFYPALELYDRVQQFWQEVLPRHVGQTLLFVTHGGTNSALIGTAIGLTPDRYHTIQHSNCGISVLNFPAGASEPAQLEALNLATHVGENLPQLKEGGQGLRLLLMPSTANPKPTQKLAQLLKEVTINFSISGSLDNSQAIREQILQYHPETVQLEVLQEDFPEAWQQAIDVRSPVTNSANSNQLVTGLVIARDAIIKRFLGQVLGMNSDQLWQLQLHEGAISCIHYPNPDHPPILQAINISGAEKDLLSGSVVAETHPVFSSSSVRS